MEFPKFFWGDIKFKRSPGMTHLTPPALKVVYRLIGEVVIPNVSNIYLVDDKKRIKFVTNNLVYHLLVSTL